MTEGPYRHGIDQETTNNDTLKKMEKQIESEKIGLSLQLSEDAKPNDPIPLFNNAYPEDIAFFSVATGILRYKPRASIDPRTKPVFYDYYNEDESSYLTVESNKKDSTKIFALDSKNFREKQQTKNNEQDKNLLLASLSEIEKGLTPVSILINRMEKNTLGECLPKLHALINQLEKLSADAKDKLRYKK